MLFFFRKLNSCKICRSKNYCVERNNILINTFIQYFAFRYMFTVYALFCMAKVREGARCHACRELVPAADSGYARGKAQVSGNVNKQE